MLLVNSPQADSFIVFRIEDISQTKKPLSRFKREGGFFVWDNYLSYQFCFIILFAAIRLPAAFTTSTI